MAEPGIAPTMRLDRFLWFARIVKTRPFAQALAERGHMRIDGRPVDRAAAPVRVGNILTFVTHRGDVRTIRIEALPVRRGPPGEAQNCYADLLVGDAEV
ncbi:MAG TPA: RNA-binding S4 domain-containing protein [Sphingomonas sp.]